MDKQHELDALAALGERLGPDSYLGPAIAAGIHTIADEMRSDWAPDVAASLLHLGRRVESMREILAELETREQEARARLEALRVETLSAAAQMSRQMAEARGAVDAIAQADRAMAAAYARAAKAIEAAKSTR